MFGCISMGFFHEQNAVVDQSWHIRVMTSTSPFLTPQSVLSAQTPVKMLWCTRSSQQTCECFQFILYILGFKKSVLIVLSPCTRGGMPQWLSREYLHKKDCFNKIFPRVPLIVEFSIKWNAFYMPLDDFLAPGFLLPSRFPLNSRHLSSKGAGGRLSWWVASIIFHSLVHHLHKYCIALTRYAILECKNKWSRQKLLRRHELHASQLNSTHLHTLMNA